MVGITGFYPEEVYWQGKAASQAIPEGEKSYRRTIARASGAPQFRSIVVFSGQCLNPVSECASREWFIKVFHVVSDNIVRFQCRESLYIRIHRKGSSLRPYFSTCRFLLVVDSGRKFVSPWICYDRYFLPLRGGSVTRTSQLRVKTRGDLQ